MRLVRLEGNIEAVAWALDRDGLKLPPFCELHLRLAFPSSPNLIPQIQTQNGVNVLEASYHPEIVLDRVLSRIWRVDWSPCKNLSMMLSAKMFNHRSAVRTILVEGLPGTSKIAFYHLLQHCVVGFSADYEQAHRKTNIIPTGPSKTHIIKDFDARWPPV
ncbi:hypothetical protein MD484_g5584, partial [Candolleomyces efflorescens]